MNFSQLIDVLRGRWRVILSAVIVCVVLAAVATLVMPSKYTATAQVLVDPRGADAVSAVGSSERPSGVLQAIIATQVDLITSERVAKRVVATLHMEQDAQQRQQWMEATEGKGSFAAWLAQGLLAYLDAKTSSRDSNVINITFVSRDPKYASTVVNAFAEAAVANNLDLKVEPAKEYTAWFEERSKTLRADLAHAQEKLAAFQREKGLIGRGDGGVDIENAKLAQLEAQLVEIQRARAESSARQGKAMGNAASSPDVLNNPVIATLRGSVANAETNLKQLQAQYGDQFPTVVSARQQLAALRGQLQSEMQTVAGSLATNDQVNAQREAAVRAEIAAQRARAFSLMDPNSDAAILQREVESAQRALEAATTRQSQTALESQLRQNSLYLLNVSDEPTNRSSPKVKVNLALGGCFGLLVGLALALWLEARAPMIRSRFDLQAVLDLPVMAVLPRMGKTPMLSFARRRLGQGPATEAS